MGRNVGIEPTHIGATIRRVNHFTNSAISINIIATFFKKSNKMILNQVKFNFFVLTLQQIFVLFNKHIKIYCIIKLGSDTMRLLETAVAETNKNNSILQKVWNELVKLYGNYSAFIHNIAPDELGNLIEYVIDIIVVALLIKLIGTLAFRKRDGSF